MSEPDFHQPPDSDALARQRGANVANGDGAHVAEALDEAPEAVLRRDPEEASRALLQVQDLLRKHEMLVELAHRQDYGEGEDKQGSTDRESGSAAHRDLR